MDQRAIKLAGVWKFNKDSTTFAKFFRSKADGTLKNAPELLVSFTDYGNSAWHWAVVVNPASNPDKLPTKLISDSAAKGDGLQYLANWLAYGQLTDSYKESLGLDGVLTSALQRLAFLLSGGESLGGFATVWLTRGW